MRCSKYFAYAEGSPGLTGTPGPARVGEDYQGSRACVESSFRSSRFWILTAPMLVNPQHIVRCFSIQTGQMVLPASLFSGWPRELQERWHGLHGLVWFWWVLGDVGQVTITGRVHQARQAVLALEESQRSCVSALRFLPGPSFASPSTPQSHLCEAQTC